MQETITIHIPDKRDADHSIGIDPNGLLATLDLAPDFTMEQKRNDPSLEAAAVEELLTKYIPPLYGAIIHETLGAKSGVEVLRSGKRRFKARAVDPVVCQEAARNQIESGLSYQQLPPIEQRMFAWRMLRAGAVSIGGTEGISVYTAVAASALWLHEANIRPLNGNLPTILKALDEDERGIEAYSTLASRLEPYKDALANKIGVETPYPEEL